MNNFTNMGDNRGQQVAINYGTIIQYVSAARDEPLPTLPPLAVADLFPPARYLIGHHEQLLCLAQTFQQVANTRKSRISFISGQPGHGRRAMLHELASLVREKLDGSVLWLRHWPAPLEQQRALLEHDSLIDPACAGIAAQLGHAWPRSAHIGGASWLWLLAQVCHALGEVLTPTTLWLPDSYKEDNLSAPLLAGLRRLARQSPIMLAFESLDDAPACWETLLKTMMPEASRDLPLHIVITLRADTEPDLDAPITDATPLTFAQSMVQRSMGDLHWLAPVNTEDVARFIAPDDPAAYATVAQALCEMTDGIPVLIASLWDEWERRELVTWDDEAGWQLASDDLLTGDILSLAQQQFDVLLPTDADLPLPRDTIKQVLHVAALEGPSFTVQAVCGALHLDADTVLDVLDDYLLEEGEQRGLVAEVGWVPVPETYRKVIRLNRYRFALPVWWHYWHKYLPDEHERPRLQGQLARALEAAYYPLTDRIADQLIALFAASGNEARAASYREQQRNRYARGADIAVLHWQVENLAAVPTDDLNSQVQLYELRLHLAARLRHSGEYAEGTLHAAAAVEQARAWQDALREARACNLHGLLLRAQGDDAAARPLYERALAIAEQVLGPQHPATAASLNNLAALLDAQGDDAAARPLYERALAIHEQVLGPLHPDTALSLNNLAALLRDQGDDAAARPLYERALAIREQVLGPLHPDTASSLNNLALLLSAQGDYAAARPLYRRACLIWVDRLGLEHPTTQGGFRNFIGLLLAERGLSHDDVDHETMMQMLQEALNETDNDTP
jgi:tetratricopeptide (TPR) repeat protein